MDGVQNLQYVFLATTATYIFGPTVYDFIFTKENLNTFMYSFITFSGVLSSTALIIRLTLGDINSIFDKYLNSKSKPSKMEFIFDAAQSYPIDYNFEKGKYLITIDYNETHTSTFLVVVSQDHLGALQTDDVLVVGKKDIWLKSDNNKIHLVSDSFMYGNVKVAHLN
jgi:hypothetical protein